MRLKGSREDTTIQESKPFQWPPPGSRLKRPAKADDELCLQGTPPRTEAEFAGSADPGAPLEIQGSRVESLGGLKDCARRTIVKF